MSIRVGINGFGRMGRLALRAAWGRDLEFVHVNELKGDAATAAHLLTFDSVHGRFARDVQAPGGDAITIDGTPLLNASLTDCVFEVSRPTTVAAVVIGGLAVFGVVFAINSSVHSYLILAYSVGDKMPLNVGFYYMANAGGRLVGTLLSGVVYQSAGLFGVLWTSVTFALASALMALALRPGGAAIALSEVADVGGD